MLAHEQLQSGTSLLDLRIATSSARPLASHALIIVHGLPRAMGMGRQAAGLLPELAEHLANESGWIVATGTLSGVGGSTGTFSATQWRADLKTILERVDEGERRISMAGFGFGGALALATAAEDERIRGVATFATPAHLEPWCGGAEDFRRAVQVAGVVGDERDLMAAEQLRDDVFAIDPLGVHREDPAASPAWSATAPRTSRSRTRTPATSSRRPKVAPNCDSSRGPVTNCAPTRGWSRRC